METDKEKRVKKMLEKGIEVRYETKNTKNPMEATFRMVTERAPGGSKELVLHMKPPSTPTRRKKGCQKEQKDEWIRCKNLAGVFPSKTGNAIVLLGATRSAGNRHVGLDAWRLSLQGTGPEQPSLDDIMAFLRSQGEITTSGLKKLFPTEGMEMVGRALSFSEAALAEEGLVGVSTSSIPELLSVCEQMFNVGSSAAVVAPVFTLFAAIVANYETVQGLKADFIVLLDRWSKIEENLVGEGQLKWDLLALVEDFLFKPVWRKHLASKEFQAGLKNISARMDHAAERKLLQSTETMRDTLAGIETKVNSSTEISAGIDRAAPTTPTSKTIAGIEAKVNMMLAGISVTGLLYFFPHVKGILLILSAFLSFFMPSPFWVHFDIMLSAFYNERSFTFESLRTMFMAFGSLSLGQYFIAVGQYERAEDLYQRALTMYRALHGQEANHLSIANILNGLGLVYYSLQNYERAEEFYQRALTMRRAVYGQETNHLSIAVTLNNLGLVFYFLEKYERAEKFLQQALTMERAVRGQEANHSSIAETLNSLGFVYYSLEKYERAEKFYQQALTMERAVRGQEANHLSIAIVLQGLGRVYNSLEKYERAEKWYQQALTMYRTVRGQEANHSGIAETLSNLGLVYYSLQNYERAEEFYQQALTMNRAVQGQEANHSSIALALYRLGGVYKSLGQFKRAEGFYQQALNMYRAVHGQEANRSNIADSLRGLGNVYYSLQNYERAKDFFQQALTMFRAVFGQEANHSGIADTLRNLGLLYECSLRDKERARTFYSQALAMRRVLYNDNDQHPKIQKLLCDLNRV